MLSALRPVRANDMFRSQDVAMRKRKRLFERDSRPSKQRKIQNQDQHKTRATLSISRKRKNSFEEKSCSRKRQLAGFENGAGKTLEELGQDLQKLDLNQPQQMEEEQETNAESTALVPVPNPRIPTMIKPEVLRSMGQQVALTVKPQLDPKQVSAEILQLLINLGYVEKVTCYGQEIHMLLKKKLEPIFSNPTSYYFQGADSTKKKVTTKILVGYWLFFVKLGYFLPFPEVTNYMKIFTPEINEKRLSKLGEAWLRQIGIDESNWDRISDPNMMDLFIKKIALALSGQQALQHEGDTVDPEDIMEIS